MRQLVCTALVAIGLALTAAPVLAQARNADDIQQRIQNAEMVVRIVAPDILPSAWPPTPMETAQRLVDIKAPRAEEITTSMERREKAAVAYERVFSGKSLFQGPRVREGGNRRDLTPEERATLEEIARARFEWLDIQLRGGLAKIPEADRREIASAFDAAVAGGVGSATPVWDGSAWRIPVAGGLRQATPEEAALLDRFVKASEPLTAVMNGLDYNP